MPLSSYLPSWLGGAPKFEQPQEPVGVQETFSRHGVIDLLARAIAKHEGYYLTPEQAKVQRTKHPCWAQLNHNPGNLRSWGTRPIVGGYAKFETPAEGWSALSRQVGLLVDRRLSLRSFFGGERDLEGKLISPKAYPGYAPAADQNAPVAYAQGVLAYCRARLPLPSSFTIDTTIAILF